MPKRLALIHTVASLAPLFKSLCDELLPGVDLFHVVDESLLQNIIRSGALSPATARRLLALLVSAQEGGAEMALVTCSSLGPAVEASRCFLEIPVYRVDEPMADLAVRSGTRIGVAATLATTLGPTAELIQARAAAAGRPVQVTAKLCAGAYAAASAGDLDRHDALIIAGLRELLSTSDVIVLAQASMARVADQIPEDERKVPILSSPRLAVQHLAQVLESPAA